MAEGQESRPEMPAELKEIMENMEEMGAKSEGLPLEETDSGTKRK